MVCRAVRSGNFNHIRGGLGHRTGALGKHYRARIDRRLIFHTGTDNRGFGFEKRHSLTLHVRTHQSTVRVVVFKERNHRGGDGNHHSRGDVHIVCLARFDFHELVTVTDIDFFADETVVFVQRLIRLRNLVIVLDICRHIGHFIEHHAGFLVDTAEGRFNKAVFVDACKSGEIGNQADVRTFGRFHGAHTAVVAVMHVANLEPGTVTRQTAGAQCRQTAFVRQFGKRVILIHKLRQR